MPLLLGDDELKKKFIISDKARVTGLLAPQWDDVKLITLEVRILTQEELLVMSPAEQK